MSNKREVRVRFAPSPTGHLHLGSARTALFNWLYARHTGGLFLLRIEDTDRERSREEYLDEILNDLKWLGMDFDGELWRQSERIQIYRNYAKGLLDKGLAYEERGAIIFKVEKARNIIIRDIVHGEISVNTDEIKNQVLIKSDGFPAYNFACVIDDHEMGITLVIRGDDHIPNTPKQLLIYEALGLEPPDFAHMPLMMAKNGSKLSKRHGGIAVSEYKKEGFLPEALSNYLLLLGWSPGNDRELISLEEAKSIFEIEQLGNVQAQFDLEKLRWLNGEYIRRKDNSKLAGLLKNGGFAEQSIDDRYLEDVVGLYKTRLRTLGEFSGLTKFFFADDFPVEDDAEKKLKLYLEDEKTKEAVAEFRNYLERLSDFKKEEIEKICRATAQKRNVKPAAIIHTTRAAISGKTTGCGLFEMMEVLGKDKVLERLKKNAA